MFGVSVREVALKIGNADQSGGNSSLDFGIFVRNAKPTFIQFRKMNMDHLINKPYINDVTLTEQNLYSKSC